MVNPITEYETSHAALLADKALEGMVQGKDKILLFRVLGDTNAARKLAFQTEHTFTFSRERDVIRTKDGSISKDNGLETEVSIEAIQKRGDRLYGELALAAIKGHKVELWEVTVDEDLKNETDEYPAIYAQGYLPSWELPAGVEDESTVSTTFNVDGEPQWGYTPLSAAQEAAVQYAFRNTEEITPEV
ncbi:phage major tail protein, TP901-1 family [Planomicrobium okeanokoites]|uniref:Phage major tail protein, TP901-1 family n=1 Tax=Planomicrobium okeanokoites TaxID=244 RepID=A0ABV7KTB3_PLAOK|nr:phage major tail protein, TP901-1 family [Planomicrobium okeanokoites]TAA71593.1 phage major tail protein, TP901-1 family [Planomicrobium okeanokoites]